MEESELRLSVNGAGHTVRCDPGTPLLDVLRHDLRLAGPRFGCGLGLCGACFVLIDGQARSSCDYPAWAAEGKQVTTVEGLAGDAPTCEGPAEGADGGGAEVSLSAVQRAFLDEQAAQCGYCTSGMIISAVALLRATPSPSEQQVVRALEGNLCRCGTHGRIVAAVMRAAAQRGTAG